MEKENQATTIDVLKLAIAAVLFSMLMGCMAPVNLTGAGTFVRQIPPESTSPCEFLGVVEEEERFSLTEVDGRRNVLNKIRNTVAEMGGNSYVPTLTTTSAGGGYTNMQVDGYLCPIKRDNVILKMIPRIDLRSSRSRDLRN